MLKRGRIVKIISNLYTVLIDGKFYDCTPRGKFRNEKITPVVGDYVLVDTLNNYIMEVENRFNFLDRPLIANVDCALVVMSVKEPNLSFNLLDKMLSIISINKIEPIICFSKVDLLEFKEKREFKKIVNYYKKYYKVVVNKNTWKLKKLLSNKMVVITGQTGVGKTTLLNKLNKNLDLKTDSISKALGRGKHTTRHTEVFDFKKFYIADTPGFSNIDFKDISKESIRDSFREFKNYDCKFKDCMHKNEKGCRVLKALEAGDILKTRYESYRNFIER